MRVVEPSTKVVRIRPKQALAARVRAAAEAAVQALHEAADDRRLIHQREWGQSDRDTLGDIDEFADLLQGYASWVLSGAVHPRADEVRETLQQIAGEPLKFRVHCTGRRQLRAYLGRLDELRVALADFFEMGDLDEPGRATKPSEGKTKEAKKRIHRAINISRRPSRKAQHH